MIGTFVEYSGFDCIGKTEQMKPDFWCHHQKWRQRECSYKQCSLKKVMEILNKIMESNGETIKSNGTEI